MKEKVMRRGGSVYVSTSGSILISVEVRTLNEYNDRRAKITTVELQGHALSQWERLLLAMLII